MECFDVKSKIGFYFDQELQTDEMEDVAAHIRQCTHCQLELAQLQEIESVVGSGIYEEPPPGYWSKTPQVITNRLGLTEKGPSLLKKLMTSIELLFATPNLRWGLAGGVAAVALLFYVFNLQKQQTEMVQQPASKPLAEERTSSPPHEDLASETESAIATAKPETEPDIMTNEPDATNVAPQQSVIETRDLVPTQVPVTLALNDESDDYATDNELRPIPASTKTISDLIASEEEAVPAPDVNALSLEHRVNSKHLNITKSTDGLSELESDYLETIKFVEESTTFEEKRNIWLSYISRQNNFTYKTLGIYHLALLLYDIADLEYDPDKAQEALDFYREEEETLRFQMGDEEYEARVSALNLILVQ